MLNKNQINNVIIIGAMKCGTTSLYNYLSKHPEFCPGVVKEPEYFSINMGEPKYKNGRYEDLFKINPDYHKFTLDGSTGYSKYPAETGVPKRIKEYGLRPYFIYIIRNPFERIESHYNFMKRDINWKAEIDSPHLINTSKYFMQLQEYEKYFDSNRIIILRLEDLKKNPSNVCNQVYKFVGASNFESNNYEIINITRPENRRKLEITSHFSKISKHIPTQFKKTLSIFINKIYPPVKNELSIKQKKEIHDQLESDMKLLKEKYNINVTEWGFFLNNSQQQKLKGFKMSLELHQ